MATLGFYFAGLSYDEANKVRKQLNEVAANLGYIAQAGPTTGEGNASALLVAIAKGEIVCRLDDESNTFPAQPGIYKIIQKPTRQDIYIGSTTNIKRRIGLHLSMLKHGSHPNRKLQAMANEDGVKSFEFQVLEILPSDELILNSREEYWQETLKSHHLLNRPLARKGFNNKLCRICGGGHYAKGLCSRHYHKFNKIKNDRREMMKKTATEIAQEIMENGLAATQEELENQFEYFAREAGWSDQEIKAAIESPWFPRLK